jgi:hypothetical protein
MCRLVIIESGPRLPTARKGYVKKNQEVHLETEFQWWSYFFLFIYLFFSCTCMYFSSDVVVVTLYSAFLIDMWVKSFIF